jgi:hypothetical protein
MLGRIKLVRTKEDEVVSSPAMIVVSVAMFIGAYQLRPYLGERLPDPEGRLSELAQRLYLVSGYALLPFVWVILVVFPGGRPNSSDGKMRAAASARVKVHRGQADQLLRL